MRPKIAVGVIAVILTVAVLAIIGGAAQAKENKRWHQVSLTATSRDHDIAGSDTRVAGFRTLDRERRWPRVAVDQRIYRGNRYEGWRTGRDELRFDNPRKEAILTVILSSIVGLCVGIIIALAGGMLYDLLRRY